MLNLFSNALAQRRPQKFPFILVRGSHRRKGDPAAAAACRHCSRLERLVLPRILVTHTQALEKVFDALEQEVLHKDPHVFA